MVCSKYFSHGKLESFTRQVNGWGFKRLRQTGINFKAYYHECLLRGLPHLTRLMKRMPKNKGKTLPDMEGKPDLSKISQSFPVPLYEGGPRVMADQPCPRPHGNPRFSRPSPHHPSTDGGEGGLPPPLLAESIVGYPPPSRGTEVQYSGDSIGLVPAPGYPLYQTPSSPTHYHYPNMSYYLPSAAYGPPPRSYYQQASSQHEEDLPLLPGTPHFQNFYMILGSITYHLSPQRNEAATLST